MQEKLESIISEIGKAFVGNNALVRKILLTVLAGGHVLLEDIPGVGKTTLALAFSRSLALKYSRVQFTPDVMPTDITGFTVYRKETNSMEYLRGAVLCNLFLADELNRAPSRTQAALLEAMEEGQVTVDGRTYKLPLPFVVLATQNPSGSAGTQLLPESQLDRFMMRLSIGYPEKKAEAEMLRRKHASRAGAQVRQVGSAELLAQMCEAVKGVYLADEIYDYIVRLVAATRQNPQIQQGVSPRGSVAIMALAQAAALMAGRDYVLPQDIQAVFEDGCAHRLILTQQARQQKEGARVLLREIMTGITAPVPVPRRR